MKLSMLVDKPLPGERPTGIGVAAFNMALALSKRRTKVRYICRGRSEQTYNLSDRLIVQTITHYSRDNLVAFLSALRSEGCEITHVHSSSAVPSILASRIFRRPAVLHAHGDEPLHPIRLTLIRKVGMSLSQRVLATSNDTKQSIVRNQRILPGKIAVVYNGVNTEEFKPSTASSDVLSRFALDGYDKIIVSVGTVQQSKGQHRIVESLPAILRRWPRLVYVNIGASDDRAYHARLLERAGEMGVSKAVRLLSGLSQPDLIALINSADLCVHPSIREGFGLAVVEEMACGKAVLAFGVDSIPEIIDDGLDGLLVEPSSKDNLAKSILDALEDPSLTKKLGDAAREKVIAKFTWDQTASRLETVYHELF